MELCCERDCVQAFLMNEVAAVAGTRWEGAVAEACKLNHTDFSLL